MSAKLVWLTGLSGSGKTTLATKLYQRLLQEQLNVVHLDGDSLREINGQDLGYNSEDRLTNAWRLHRLALFLINQDINVVCSTISLFHQIHQANRNSFKQYYEIFVDCEKKELIRRNQKGLYSDFNRNKMQNLAGFDQEVEFPLFPHLVIKNTLEKDLSQNLVKILKLING